MEDSIADEAKQDGEQKAGVSSVQIDVLLEYPKIHFALLLILRKHQRLDLLLLPLRLLYYRFFYWDFLGRDILRLFNDSLDDFLLQLNLLFGLVTVGLLLSDLVFDLLEVRVVANVLVSFAGSDFSLFE